MKRSRFKEVAAHRVKYEKTRQRIPPYQMAHHQKNRDGFCPNAQRCEELLLELVGEFDCDEADHDAVCVELPRGDDEASKQRRKNVIDHNVSRARGIDTLATVQPLELRYSKIGSSHLDQVLSNIASGARAQRSDLQRFCDGEGRLSLSLIKAYDSDLGRYASTGLNWQVLDSRMEIEQPGAVELIMSVLNVKKEAQMAEHEFQALARLSRIVSTPELALAGRVAEETVQEKLSEAGMSELAYSDDFRGVLAFVVNSGASKSIHMERLFAFHNYCISARSRRIRFSTIAALSGIPVNAPRTRNLLTKYAYSGTVCNGFCTALNSQKIAIILQEKRRDFLSKVEAQLKVLHDDYMQAYNGLDEGEHARLMTRIDLQLTPALFERDLEEAATVLTKKVNECHDILGARLKGKNAETFNQLSKHRASGGTASGGTSGASTLQPRIITFSPSGDAVNKQDTQKETQEKWCELDCTLHNGLVNTEGKSRIIVALALAGESLQQTITDDVIAKKIEGSRGFNKAKVEVKRNFAAREIAILPRVRGPECITAKAISERAAVTDVADVEGNYFHITPSISEAAGSEFQPLFWMIPFTLILSQANLVMDYLHVDINAKARLRASGSEVPALKVKSGPVVHTVKIPYITNPAPIESGTALCLHVEPKKKDKKTKKSTSWVDVKPNKTKESKNA